MKRLTKRQDKKIWFYNNAIGQYVRLLHRTKDGYDECFYEVTEKLAAYEDAEEQGRLLMLPVPIGDKVFVPSVYSEEDGKVIAEVEELTLSGFVKEGSEAFYTTYDEEHGSCDIEVDNVFKKLEEAENALAEMAAATLGETTE